MLDFAAMALFITSESMVGDPGIYFLLCQNITASAGFHLIYIWILLQALGAAVTKMNRPTHKIDNAGAAAKPAKTLEKVEVAP